jgi:hypothetical protein
MTIRDLAMNKIYQGLIKDDEGENEGELLRVSEDGSLEMKADPITLTARLYKGKVQTISVSRPWGIDIPEDEILDIGNMYKEAIDKAIHHLKAMNSNGGSYAYH